MKRIQQKLIITEEQANQITKLIKEIKKAREDYTICLRSDLENASSYKKFTDAEIVIKSLNNQLHEEKWNILNIVSLVMEEENENN